MKRREVIKAGAFSLLALWSGKVIGQPTLGGLEMNLLKKGPLHFEPTWDSLAQYQFPDWFRNAKFGIWAHWGPQCQPEHGDWYARSMYIEGSRDYNFHLKEYGHPSKFGFKDVIRDWKADKWNPEYLVALYKQAGARYFMAMANHHDNFDNFNSRYQPWNSLTMGPHKDLIAGWEAAARSNGLRFGVSVHASHAWSFYEKAQKADTAGDFKGVPYDGNIRKSQGFGQWWHGYNPQDLYAQNHPVSPGSDDQAFFFKQWDWSHGATIPDKRYCEKFFKRTISLIDDYKPDMVYFDDTVLPLYPISDVGLRIAAHMYNANIKRNKGSLEAVITGKILNERQRACLVWDIERGHSNRIEPLPWQTCTCIGDWHYDRAIYDEKRYKKPKEVVNSLVDIVSKNGNLLLNIPVRGDGTIDEQELKIVREIGKWMKINGEGIYDTRPWKVFGEGPAIARARSLSNQGFNEGGAGYTAQDIRFTTKGKYLYATCLGIPTKAINIQSLGLKTERQGIKSISLLGSQQKVNWKRYSESLWIEEVSTYPSEHSATFKIEMKG